MADTLGDSTEEKESDEQKDMDNSSLSDQVGSEVHCLEVLLLF